ncbi:MAG TPA: hypothetical protein VMJ35_06015 [Dongiaceae bacterium]|nr:hypothetical protein [Dongiaceae bacterium]
MAATNRVNRDVYVVAIPLVLWICSFFLPTITLSSSDWFFPGTNPGIVAALDSFLAGILVASEFRQLFKGPFQIRELLFLLSASVLWVANLWMLKAPFVVNRLQLRSSRSYIIALWLWVLVPLPIALNTTPQSYQGLRIEVGFFVWWASFGLLALCATTLHLTSPVGKLLPYPPPQK